MSATTHDQTSDPRARDFRIADRLTATAGQIHLGGLQALVRLPLDQARRDRAAGLRTGGFISGYEGSPLGGYDKELLRLGEQLAAAGVVFRPAVNEELAANAVLGSQLASTRASRTVDGVAAYWYGKAPGLDRATDALRHGNLGGASPLGGVLALVGDDATAKSSTVPSSSEWALAELGMPVLAPADPQDILRLGLHGIAMSRFSGLWVALKLATNVVDGSATVTLGEPSITLPDNTIDGQPFVHAPHARFLQPGLAQLEESLVGARPELALRYARANGLDEIVGDQRGKIGIVAAGQTYRNTLEALTLLGVKPDRLGQSGIRVLKLGLVAPLDVAGLLDFAAGLDEIIVVEEKRPLVETAIKSALYGRADAPRVGGKQSPDGQPLLRAHADLPAQLIAQSLGHRIAEVLGSPTIAAATAALAAPHTATRPTLPLAPAATRTPYFCSGCPHNRSTATPGGSLVAAGIGCHTLVVFMDPERVGDVIGFTQMGGEGAAWIGMSPFVSEDHLVQNLGDGTYHHSGTLAVRAAVAAGVNVTYRILCNGAVAMTGGQDIVGGMPVPRLAAELLAEGVAKVAITTEDPSRYAGARLPDGVRVHHRDDLESVLADLAAVPGVTALLNDQECATELRRKRKRGLAATPNRASFINERVCEGCGDCGAKSNCLSVQPVETEFGRKTRIHQASCNKDFSCFDGDCPSFIEVTPGSGRPRAARTARELAVSDLPEPPVTLLDRPIGVRLMGIGGTGIVTTAQVLAVAATNAGLFVRGLDQLGLSQKGGAVISDVRISPESIEGTNAIGPGECDVYVGADLLVATAPTNLVLTDAGRTWAVVSTTRTPTGSMVADPAVTFPGVDPLMADLSTRVRPDSVILDARAITEGLFGSDQLTNTFLLGVAVQSGALPLPPAAVEDALSQNGVAVEANHQAFRWGRRYAAAPDAVVAAAAPPPSRSTRAAGTTAYGLVRAAGLPTDGELGELIARRAEELTAYQDPDYARTYLHHLAQVHRREQAAVPDATSPVTAAVARGLFKLMAYKDEYEVARLSTDPAVAQAIREQFGPDAGYAFRLHPPLLRALGVDSKLALGTWALPALRGLYAARRLRGSALDPFGHTTVRRAERSLIDEYLRGIVAAVGKLTPDTRDTVVAIAALPDVVRGYEDIKLGNVERFRTQLREQLRTLLEADDLFSAT
ncbi:indolepyruvate ferredoxin oxidoreductase family protein [Nostocoides australiense]